MGREIINQKFNIHPVGQGFFYSAVVKLSEHNKFRFVFDCGSNNGRNCKDEITQFRASEQLPATKIDTLVISHFDADHVNHIQKLLEGGVKVDKLIMPFILFEERLFLALKYLVEGDSIDDDDTPQDVDSLRAFTLSLILDPAGTLSANLEGGEIILLENGPNEPTGDNEPGGSLPAPEGPLTFDFDRNAKQNLSEDEKNVVGIASDGITVTKIADDNHAYLSAGVRIMEFIFYRRNIGTDEKAFYANVQTEFCKHFGIGETLEKKELREAIKEKALHIASAGEIKAIFRNAKKGLKLSADGRDIADPNTTALCMLHRNLPAIHPADEPIFRYPAISLSSITKPEGTQNKKTVHYDWDWYHYRFPWKRRLQLIGFPNTLLTSDSFLRDSLEVDEFYKKYQHYWSDYWMFQIPHHGAERNANKNLFARLSGRQYAFINYGINNRDDHPNERVMHDLAACGLSANYFAINEFNGLEFIYRLFERT